MSVQLDWPLANGRVTPVDVSWSSWL